MCWSFHLLWSIADRTLLTERSSAGCSDAFLTDARRAETFATTAAPNSVENSYLGEEAINWMLPSKKTTSPSRSDRELTPCSRAGGEGSEQQRSLVSAWPGSRPSVPGLLPRQHPFPRAPPPPCRAAFAEGASAYGASFPSPSVVPSAFARVHLSRSGSRHGCPGRGTSPVTGALPSSERPADGAPILPLFTAVGVDAAFHSAVGGCCPQYCR